MEYAGSCATIDVFKDSSLPHFLIAPVFKVYEELVKRVLDADISKRLFEQFVTSVETEYGMSVREKDILADTKKIKQPIHIVHSKTDKIAPHHFSEGLAAEQGNIHLESLPDAGHMRIVAAEETEQALVRFLDTVF